MEGQQLTHLLKPADDFASRIALGQQGGRHPPNNFCVQSPLRAINQPLTSAIGQIRPDHSPFRVGSHDQFGNGRIIVDVDLHSEHSLDRGRMEMVL